MKQVICVNPFELKMDNVEEPILKPGELIVEIKRIGICGTDIHAYRGEQPFFTYPRVLGHELAGIIRDHNHSKKFKNGDRVTIIPYLACRNCITCASGKPNCCPDLKVLGVHIDGGLAELMAIPEENIVLSQGLSLDFLALIEPLAIALHGIKRAQLKKDDWVIVFGAGPIGLGALLFAKTFTHKVIAIDLLPERIQFCKIELGIIHVFNGIDENLYEKIGKLTEQHFADVIIDATGNKNAIQNQLKYLSHGGKWVLIGLQKEEIQISHPEFHKRESTLMSSRNATKIDFDEVIQFIIQQKIRPEVFITHRLKMEDIPLKFGEIIEDKSLIKGIIEIND